MNETTATIGHNLPPSAIEEIHARYHQLFARRDDLLAAVSRAPTEISDDDTAGKVSDLVKLLTACHKAAEGARIAEKEPYLEAGRAVDGLFKRTTDPLSVAKGSVQSILNGYLRAKADAARRVAQEAAAKAAENARRLADAAMSEGQLDLAIAAEDKAIKLADAAAAPPADLSRTRGDYGSVASLRQTWEYEVVDLATVPAQFHMLNVAAVRACRASAAIGN